MDESDIPTWLTTPEVAVPVRRLPGREGSSVIDWTCERLTGGGGEGLGVWRLRGNALTDTTLRPWSLVLKGMALVEPDLVPSARNWPYREKEMYRSGLLDDMPGSIRAPAYFGDRELPDGSVWLWLEDMADGMDVAWPRDRYAKVARDLGHFNGSFLDGRPLPDDSCLSRDWLRQWVEATRMSMAELSTAANHPLVRQVYPPHVVNAYTRFWVERHRHYAVIDQLPQTFCHLDAFRRNIFTPQTLLGQDATVLIDWAFAGIAAIGEELAPLIAMSIIAGEVPPADVGHLQDIALNSYVEGLRDAGWRGNPALVRRGYAIAVTLRYGVGVLRLVLPILLDERLQPGFEELLGRPMDEIIPMLAGLNEWLSAMDLEV